MGPPGEFASFYDVLEGSTAPPPGDAEPVRLDESQLVTSETTDWSFRRVVPWQFRGGTGFVSTGRRRARALLITPGSFDGIAVLSPRAAASVSGAISSLAAAEPQTWLIGIESSSLLPLYFISDGRGMSFLERWSAVSPALDVAAYGPGVPNPWGLRDRAHIVELELLEGQGERVVLDASVVESPVSATSLILSLAERFNAERDVQGAALDALLRAHHVAATSRQQWLHPTFDAETNTLRVLFVRRASGHPESTRDSPCIGERSDGDSLARAELAMEYTVDLSGRLLREHRYVPRAETSWDRPDAFGRVQPHTTTTSTRARVASTATLDVRGVVTRRHQDWANMPQPATTNATGRRTVWWDAQALTWYGPETWWPVSPLPTRMTNAPLGSASQTDRWNGPLQVVQVVDIEGAGPPRPTEGGDRLAEWTLALRGRFSTEIARRQQALTSLRQRLATEASIPCASEPWFTLRVTPAWVEGSQRVQMTFAARFEERALGRYLGGAENPDPNAQEIHWWYSEIVVIYEIDLAGRLYSEDIFPPRADAVWLHQRP